MSQSTVDDDLLPQDIDIVVTAAPSSPETTSSPSNARRRPTEADSDTDVVLSVLPLDSLAVPGGDHSLMPTTTAPTPFEQAMANASLPEPGPAFFAARRAIWQTPRASRPPTNALHPRLRSILERDGPIDDDEYWGPGIEKFYKALVSGRKLKDPLPLRYLLKTLQAGWIRDGTWPKGQVAPDLDDMTLDPPSSMTSGPSKATSPVSSGTSTPQNRSRFLGFFR